MSERDLNKPDPDFEAARVLARKAIYEDGRGMIGANRNYLEYRVARAILAERREQATTIARLSEALAEAEKKGAEDWQPIETAPRGRIPFVALNQDGEVHVAAYDEHGRLMRRSHSTHRLQSFSIENGRKILISETEEWRNDWSLWTRLYEFKPTLWHPLPAPPRDLSQGGQP